MSSLRRAPASPDLADALRLIDRIYAAGAGERSWSDALQELRQQGGFGRCLLTSVDPEDRRPLVLCGDGERRAGEAGAAFLPCNPLLTDAVLGSASGALWSDHELLPSSLLQATGFWTDWMRPASLTSWGCMILGRRAGQVVCLDVYARERPSALDADGRCLLNALAPHLTRAWRLGETGEAGEAGRRGRTEPAADAVGPAAGASEASRLAGLRVEFGLTKAEARLALALAEGCSPAEAAQAFDVKLSTVRSQLQQIFAKTGTARQAELVALLLARPVTSAARL